MAEQAMKDVSTLKEAAMKSGDLDDTTHDKVVDAKSMVGHGLAGTRASLREEAYVCRRMLLIRSKACEVA